MKDFAKSIRTKNANVGNFEDPKKAEYFIKMWQYRKEEAERALRNAELNIKELHRRKSPFGFDSMHAKEVKANEEAKKAAEADIKKYSDLIKTAAKTTWGNKKTGNKAIILKDGDVWVVLYANETKSQEFETEAEAREFAKKVGNSKVWNAKDKNGIELKVGDVVAVKTGDPKLNHGKIKRISGDQVSVDVTGNDDIWTTPARLVVKMGNSKVENADPRIASLKTKLQNLAKQGDEGAIKDVERFVEDMIKQLSARKEQLYKDINSIEEDRQGYLDLRGEVMSARYEATHMKK